MMGGIGFRHNQKAAGILINPVNDARSFGPADPGKIAVEMMEQRVYERTPWRSRGRVDDHSRGFINDDQVIVFEHNRQGNVFWRDVNLDSLGYRDLENVRFRDARFGVDDGLPIF
jgi:hypothetical protein